MEQTFTSYKNRISSAASLMVFVALCCILPSTGWAQPLAVTIATTNVACFGGNTGGAVATATGGTAPYSYAWSNGGNTPGISNLVIGTYTVTVTATGGATATATTTITQPPTALGVIVASNAVICTLAPDGDATAAPFNGTPGYTYAWSNGGTGAQITGLAAGTYTVTVTDANGCTTTGSTTVLQFGNGEGLWLMINGNGPGCPGVNNGSLYVTPMSGTAPYTYLWNNGANTQTISNLGPGTYEVTVTDINGCSASLDTTIVQGAASNLGVSVSANAVICIFAPDGSATAVPFNGTAPYTYAWSNGGTGAQITGLAAGTYCVTVTDAAGCTATGCADVVQFGDGEGLWLMINDIDVSCPGANDGSAHVSPMSGTAPYTYIWSNGGTGQDIINLAPGTYCVTVTDVNGCFASTCTEITEPTQVVAVVNTTPANCGLQGTATVIVNGGTGPYAIIWSNGQTNFTINVPAGSYSATVTDGNGCTTVVNTTVSGSPNTLVITGSVTAGAGCIIGGSAAVSVSGGSGNYSYLWDNGSTGSTASNLTAGNHSVTVTDITTGCVGTATINIPLVSPNLTVNITVNSNASCLTGGSATANVVGGAAPFTYAWSNGQSTQTAINLIAGPHSVTATDATGCVGTATTTITQSSGPTVTAQVNANATCLTGGSATATATGGTAPYVFLWSNGQSTATATNLPPGTATVTVTDAAGCPASASVTITPPALPVLVITASSNASCSQPGSATASVSGGTGPFTYLWSNGETTATAVNLTAGTYTVTITAANGCTATASVTIGQVNNGIQIGDYVWYDNDQNGFQDPPETAGVPGITVMLMTAGPDGTFGNADDVTLQTTITNGAGKYLFDCVTPGTYVLMFTGLPGGYMWTKKDFVNNDCKDSDVKSNGKTDPFVISAGQGNNLCFDAGIHTICIQVMFPGTICCNQTICEGDTPAALFQATPPLMGQPPYEYLWMQLVQMGPAGPAWVGIPGATQSSYQPGPLFQTSYFMRCIRSQGCSNYLESNIVTITVLPAGSPGCSPFIQNFVVSQLNDHHVAIDWTTAPESDDYLYTVEHSTNQTNWNPVTSVLGKHIATGPNHYTVVDETPANGKNFYRIKRSSTLGGDNFSDVRTLELSMTIETSVDVYPNPVGNVLTIKNYMEYDSDVQIDVTSSHGVILHSITIPKGTLVQNDLPMGHLMPGIYTVRVRFSKGNVKTSKLVKY